MEYRLGNYKTIKFVGETVDIECPKCKSTVNMQIYSNGEFKLTGKLPFFDAGKVYFLVCPHCSALYGIDEQKGRNFSNGEKLAVGNYDLKELNEFHV